MHFAANRLVAAAASAAALCCVAGPAAAASCPAGHHADGNDCDWKGTPSYVSGTSVYSRGEFVYTDFVHDDYGANVDGFRSGNPDIPQPITGVYPNLQELDSPRFGSTASNGLERFRHSGDYGYPPNGAGGAPTGYDDVADILEFREALGGGALHFLVRLGDMTSADSTVVGIGIDADRNAATGATAWPRGANMVQPLGYDYFVTLWGKGGEITDYTKSPPVTTPVKVAANTSARPPFMEADVPLPAGATPGTWRTYVGSGMWDASAQAWRTALPTASQTGAPGSLTTGPNIYNLLFRPNEANNWWRDTTQADDLAHHDISEDHADIDMGTLAAGRSGPALRRTGELNLQYRTIPLGSGEGEDAGQSVFIPAGSEIYKGPVQPYTMVLPSDYYSHPRPRPFVFFYHCANCNQNIWPYGVEDSATPHENHVDDTAIGTTHIQNIVDTNQVMVGGALQRGEEGPGSNFGDIPGAGERDLRDIYSTMLNRDRWAIDPNRVIYSGMSMGGSTTDTMMTLYPDEIAAAVAHSSTFGTPARIGNIRDVYYMQISGDQGLDSTASTAGRQTATTLDDMGYRHMYIEYIGRSHDFNLVYESLPIVSQTGWKQVRDPNPARVTFERDRSAEDSQLGLIHDHAYWATGLALPAGAASGQIDAIALPLAYKLPTSTSHLQGTFVNSTTGNQTFVDWLEWNRDLTGHGLQDFQPGWQPGPDVTVTNAKVAPPDHSGANGFSATTSYSAETLDLDRMQVDTAQTITGWIDAAGPTSLTVTTASLGGARSVTLDGKPIAAKRTATALTVAIPSGKHVLVIGPPSCLDRRKFTFRIHQPRRGRITRVTIFVNGHRKRVVHGRRVTGVTVRRLPRGTFKVRIVARSSRGSRTISTRTYHGCTKSRPRTRVRRHR